MCNHLNLLNMRDYKKGDKVLHNGKTMTVVDVVKAEEAGGWQDTVTVTDGTDTFEIGEYDCVHAPDGNVADEVSRLYGYLSKNGIYGEIWQNGGQLTELLVEWGDWKHDHGFADYLMSLVGYRCVGQNVTEDDGSDCYSAVHTYVKTAA